MSAPITVSHGQGFYAVHVRTGVLAQAGVLIREVLGNRRAVVITDATLAPRLGAWHLGFTEDPPLAVPPGELAKTRAQWAELTDALLASGLGRDGAIVAVGGGSVGDVAGFVAATYLRGIPFVQVPTTLLAMLDASVGGKVAVDTPHGKNLVGAFHPPALVLSDPQVLASLPERDYLGGMAEAIKHGLIADAGYLDWIVASAAPLRARNLDAVERLVHRSVEIKASIVCADERESGERAVLNAGHTVAHALELVSGYALSHGEAVGLGLLAECALAESLGVASGLRGRVLAALSALGLPVRAPVGLAADRVAAAMVTDKKNRGGQVRFALVSAVGRPHRTGTQWTTPADQGAIGSALATIL